MAIYNFFAFQQRATVAIRTNFANDMRTLTIKRVCTQLKLFDEYLQQKAIKTWAAEFKLSEKVLKIYVNGESEKGLTKAEELREFLLTYNIRQNEISGELSIEKDGNTFTKQELIFECTENKFNTKSINILLNVRNENYTVIQTYNPLHKYFMKLADNYKGEPVIEYLASLMPAMQFADRPEGFYQQRLKTGLHKWLCMSVGQILGICKNDVMLLLCEGVGGSGKTYFIHEWLFSLPELKKYYIKIGEKESFIDYKQISRTKFAINFDELPISRNGYDKLKSIIVESDGDEYDKKTGLYYNYKRMVNYIASTNKVNRNKQPGYLLDDDPAYGRRIFPIELDGKINRCYSKEIDREQLLGQAIRDILAAKETNNSKLLSWECDWDEMRYQNAKYVDKKNIEGTSNIVMDLYPPATESDGILMNASEILHELGKKGFNVGLNEVKLGLLLTKNNYKWSRHKKDGVLTWGYYVKKTSN